MPDLKQGECESWDIKVAEQGLFFQGLKQVSNIVYAETEASKKDCLYKDLSIAWTGKQIQYSPRQGLARSNFFMKWFKQTKFSSFGKGTARWMFCAPISVEIICFEHLQQVSYEIFNPDTFLQEYVQPNASQVVTMTTLWKIITVFHSSSWNFSSQHYVTYFICQSLQKFTEKVTSKVLFRKIGWENIHFYGFKKKTFISNGKKI